MTWLLLVGVLMAQPPYSVHGSLGSPIYQPCPPLDRFPLHRTHRNEICHDNYNPPLLRVVAYVASIVYYIA